MSAIIVPVNYFDECEDLTATTSEAAFPVTNLQSNVRSNVWRSTDLTSHVVEGTFGGNARPVSMFGIWPSGNEATLMGAEVRVQLWSDEAMSVSVYDQTLDFFDFSGTGWGSFAWGSHPWGVDPANRIARLTPLIRYFTGVTCASFRFTFTDSAMDATYFESRRIWLGDAVTATYMPSVLVPGWESQSQQERTPGGTLRRLVRTPTRRMTFELMFNTEAERAAFNDLLYASDPGREIVWSFFQDQGRKEHHFTIMGSMASQPPMPYEAVNFHTLRIEMVES